MDAVLDRVGADIGPVDTLVNNAGGQFVSPAEAISLNGFRAVTRLNLDAVWSLTTAVANRWMVTGGYGKVVSVVISPRRAMPGMAHSAAARAGVENMTRTMAVEWGRYGIRLNCVAPGIIHTDAWERYGLAPDAVAAAIPAGHAGHRRGRRARDHLSRVTRGRLRHRRDVARRRWARQHGAGRRLVGQK